MILPNTNWQVNFLAPLGAGAFESKKHKVLARAMADRGYRRRQGSGKTPPNDKKNEVPTLKQQTTSNDAKTESTNEVLKIETTAIVKVKHVTCSYLTSELKQYYVRIQCPFCAEEHHHSSNTGKFDAADARLANCGRGKYVLQTTDETTYSTRREGDCIIS